jgi:hypothetical protein
VKSGTTSPAVPGRAIGSRWKAVSRKSSREVSFNQDRSIRSAARFALYAGSASILLPEPSARSDAPLGLEQK